MTNNSLDKAMDGMLLSAVDKARASGRIEQALIQQIVDAIGQSYKSSVLPVVEGKMQEFAKSVIDPLVADILEKAKGDIIAAAIDEALDNIMSSYQRDGGKK